jgi:hypothetical protein
VRGVAEAAGQDASRCGRPEQPCGRVLEGGDWEELLGHRGVAFGRGQHPVDIGVDDPDQERPWSLTWGKARSEPTVSCQAILIGLAAARKNRWARSRSPPAKVSCRAAAWSAATDMPRAYAGLVLQSASPKTSSPGGKRRTRS